MVVVVVAVVVVAGVGAALLMVAGSIDRQYSFFLFSCFLPLAFGCCQELTRELLADGLRRALEMLGEAAKSQFLEPSREQGSSELHTGPNYETWMNIPVLDPWPDLETV